MMTYSTKIIASWMVIVLGKNWGSNYESLNFLPNLVEKHQSGGTTDSCSINKSKAFLSQYQNTPTSRVFYSPIRQDIPSRTPDNRLG